MDAIRARDLSRSILEQSLPRRWSHSQGVAARARGIAPILGDDAELLECAAWLHDIGYAPKLVDTGFHPLDGARYLRDVEKAENRLCNLVAHHSCALIEAEERCLADILSGEFSLEGEELVEAMTYCDMTTTPDGEETTAVDRVEEIFSRYGPEHVVTRSIRRARPQIIAASHAVLGRMERTRVVQRPQPR